MDERFTHAVDLVSYIRSTPEFADSFCIGVAGHLDSSLGVSFYSCVPLVLLSLDFIMQLTPMDIRTRNTPRTRKSTI